MEAVSLFMLSFCSYKIRVNNNIDILNSQGYGFICSSYRSYYRMASSLNIAANVYAKQV